jgi:hypothetical protein
VAQPRAAAGARRARQAFERAHAESLRESARPLGADARDVHQLDRAARRLVLELLQQRQRPRAHDLLDLSREIFADRRQLA